MQMQPYQPHDLASAGAERIHVPVSGPSAATSTPPPSLIAVFAREAWKRKPLLFLWGLVTAIVTLAVVLQFAQPLYRAEGKFVYQPNYRSGAKPIYTPPNIQSAIQILKSSEALDPVRAKHLPNVSANEFANNVRVEVSKQSEFIDISYDHPDRAVAEAVATDLMEEGLKTFANVRTRTTKDTIVQVRNDLDKSKKRLEEAKEAYRKAHESRGVADPQVELVTVQTDLADVNRQIRAADEKEAGLKEQIRVLEQRRDAPAGTGDPTADESFFQELQALIAKLQTDTNNQQLVDAATINLTAAKRKEAEMRPLMIKGVIQRTEYDDIVTQIRLHEATLKRADESKQLREDLQKKYDDLKKKMAGGKPLRRAVVEELDKLNAELAAIPVTRAALTAELGAKKKALTDLAELQKELGPKDEEIRLLRTRLQDFDAQLSDAADRSQDLNANDLRIHSAAAAGMAPHSTNAPKLGLALVGASALLFVGYMSLFALPRVAPGSLARSANAPASGLPRALVALVPYLQPAKRQHATGSQDTAQSPPAPAGPSDAANGTHPTVIAAPSATDSEPVTAWGDSVGRAPAGDGPATAVASKPTRRTSADAAAKPLDPEPAPVQVLADRISEDWVDRGGIVLFTPTAHELNVGPAMGDLGQIFTQRGERVLVFDARHDAATPTWAGAGAPDVAHSVEGFLDGRAQAPGECFVCTDLNGVEYSRADLSTRVAGVMAAHRFRQLVEEMRERYSLVFLVSPPVTLDGGDSLLATLAEGMVLVTESSANPTEVHAYLETLTHQAPARVYGTLAVPKA